MHPLTPWPSTRTASQSTVRFNSINSILSTLALHPNMLVTACTPCVSHESSLAWRLPVFACPGVLWMGGAWAIACVRRPALATPHSQKFMDALLATAKMELLMPRVEIMSEGDYVNELHILLAGAAARRWRGWSRATRAPAVAFHECQG